MIFKKNREILLEKLKNQTLAFDLTTNLPYVLNDVAAFILLNTDGKKNLTSIAEEICREFDVPYYQALDDIKRVYDKQKAYHARIKVRPAETE